MPKRVVIEISDTPSRDLFGRRLSGVVERVIPEGVTRGLHGESPFTAGIVVALDRDLMGETKVILIRRHKRRLPEWLEGLMGYTVYVNKVTGTNIVSSGDTLALARIRFKLGL